MPFSRWSMTHGVKKAIEFASLLPINHNRNKILARPAGNNIYSPLNYCVGMANFDFNVLSPHEFECLARDILEIREAPLKFRTYAPGRDGGIDISCINSALNIAGQVRLYQRNNFSKLKLSLKKELEKVKQINPDRYILITSVSLSPAQETAIVGILGKYLLSREDIIDRDRLNKFLSDKACLHVLKGYTKLLIPDIHVLEYILSEILNGKVAQNSSGGA